MSWPRIHFDRDELEAAFAAGKSAADVARKRGCWDRTVRKAARAAGVRLPSERPRPPRPAEAPRPTKPRESQRHPLLRDRDWLAGKLAAGWSVTDIAEAVGRHKSTVYDALNAAGLRAPHTPPS